MSPTKASYLCLFLHPCFTKIHPLFRGARLLAGDRVVAGLPGVVHPQLPVGGHLAHRLHAEVEPECERLLYSKALNIQVLLRSRPNLVSLTDICKYCCSFGCFIVILN